MAQLQSETTGGTETHPGRQGPGVEADASSAGSRLERAQSSDRAVREAEQNRLQQRWERMRRNVHRVEQFSWIAAGSTFVVYLILHFGGPRPATYDSDVLWARLPLLGCVFLVTASLAYVYSQRWEAAARRHADELGLELDPATATSESSANLPGSPRV